MSTQFNARDVSVAYPGNTALALAGVTLRIDRGSFFSVIGPNGSGKSTFVKALLGALPLSSGTLEFEGLSITAWSRHDLALRIGAVSQLEDMPFPITVRELVAMGRYPHMGALRAERAADVEAISRAMKRCDVHTFARRAVSSLSGGERQRARIARALAQEPATLVLDEPTGALDIGHEMAVFELLRSLSRNDGWTIVIATHHINLAARFADSLLLLDRGRVAAHGKPDDVMRKDILEEVYGWPLLVYAHEGSGFDRSAPQVTPISNQTTVYGSPPVNS